MALISLKDVGIGFGDPALIENANLQIEAGERICVIGRNGAGKSTLLRLIHGEILPDSGTVARTPGLKTALLIQEAPADLSGTIYDVAASGLTDHAVLLKEHNRLSLMLEENSDPSGLERLNEIEQEFEPAGAWQLHQRVRTVISRMGLNADTRCESLSAGYKRRVYLARALVSDPDILLLDEPTNHLDIESIAWMEDYLIKSAGTLVFVAHDRAFLKRLATRIVELDRGVLTSFAGGYERYLARKQAMIENEETRNAEFDKKLQREETWIRQGVKARRTRNEGRVRVLMKLREEFAQRRAQTGNIRFLQQEAERSGRLVILAENICFSFEDRPLIKDLSVAIMRGDKVGVIGPNGCGKTTLLRILLGEIAPDSGLVRHGTRLQIAYFDQLRARLDENRTVQQNVAEDGDTVVVNGRARHVIGYLQDFLFSPDQARAPISRLSGGERNRLLLARLFTRPSNLLVLDEPTNDLDVESLELLEAMLVDYAGTVLMVSHDRTFLNNVAASTLVFEGQGKVRQYVGGYDDWLNQRPEPEPSAPKPPSKKSRPKSAPAGVRKLTFKEQRELEKLPEWIESLEARKAAIFKAMADPGLYKTSGAGIIRMQAELEKLEQDLEAAYARWEQLEEISLKTEIS